MFEKSKENFRKLKISDIPVGRENAISEESLRNLTGLDSRRIRRGLVILRKKYTIFSRTDGLGFYRPSVNARHQRREK